MSELLGIMPHDGKPLVGSPGVQEGDFLGSFGQGKTAA